MEVFVRLPLLQKKQPNSYKGNNEELTEFTHIE